MPIASVMASEFVDCTATVTMLIPVLLVLLLSTVTPIALYLCCYLMRYGDVRRSGHRELQARFKVRPELKNGQSGPESDESEPIQTAIVIPIAANLDNLELFRCLTIALTWME